MARAKGRRSQVGRIPCQLSLDPATVRVLEAIAPTKQAREDYLTQLIHAEAVRVGVRRMPPEAAVPAVVVRPVWVSPVYAPQTGLYVVDVPIGEVRYYGAGATVEAALAHVRSLIWGDTGWEIPVRVRPEEGP